VLVRHGYRLDEIARMTRPELEARIELIAPQRKGRKTYTSRRNKKARR